MFLLPPRSTRTDTLFPYTTLSRSRGDVLLFQHHVAALVVFVGLDDVLPRDFLAGLGVDPLIADPRVVARIEHAERDVGLALAGHQRDRSEEHTSDLQSLMRISYAVFCLKKNKLTEHRSTQVT